MNLLGQNNRVAMATAVVRYLPVIHFWPVTEAETGTVVRPGIDPSRRERGSNTGSNMGSTTAKN